MPSNWLYMDTNFPTFTGEESSAEKITTIQNYMYMLVEQLRYCLHNLDGKNFNATGLVRIGETITDPVYARIEDDEGRMLEMSVEAARLAARLSDAEGNVTQLQATATGLDARITDAEGNINTLVATATSLAVALGDAQGNITQLQLTATQLTAAVSDAQGNITALQATVGSMSLSVSNGTDSSMLYLTANGATLASAQITFSGVVTFTDLSSANGYTIIDGGNITTGVVSGIKLEGNEVVGGTVTGATLQSVSGTDNGLEIYYGAVSPYLLVGGIRFDDRGAGTLNEAKYRMFVYTNSGYMAWAMKLQSAAAMSLESAGRMFLKAGENLILAADGDVELRNGFISAGGGEYRFYSDGIYYNGTKIVSTT